MKIMSLRLEVGKAKSYVRAVSGLFINARTPSGLTSKEIEIIALLMEHSKSGIITQNTRKKVMEVMGMKRQSLYNMMTILKSKNVMNDGELNRLFTVGEVNVKYATDSRDNRG